MSRHRVVIIGSGFGGLTAAKALRRVPKGSQVDITLISKTTTHLFQPLLYQVATGILSEGEIAPATRLILRRQKNVRVLWGDVSAIDLSARTVTSHLMGMETVTPYDSLIVAAGAQQSYFGHDEYAAFAPGMKSIDDALELRGRILGAFEAAEVTTDPAERKRRLTFVVVGAGPTGVEVAGQIVELAERTLAGAFRTIKPSDCRVILLDAAPAVLPPMGAKLGLKAQRRLEKMGVEVQLNAMVTAVDYMGITIKEKDGGERRIECACKVWAAGVQASELGKMIAEQSDGTEIDRAGRVLVEPDLTVKGHPYVFVVGDLMSVPGVPGMAQGAIQGAKYATAIVKQALKGKDDPANRKPFRYFDKGSMATVSRFSAVAQVGKLEFGGFIAWLAWLVLHVYYLVGHKNRFTAVLAWLISFLGRGRGQMAITSQMVYARVVTQWMEAHTQGVLAAAEEAEDAEQKAAG
ncbi:NAD(P)/FAD-dependent oxidoreductase [Mycobacterium heidelbergense]|uniref:NADH:ubiquinone reductase (non-electrogenic) n=1 Tax=Mycobacterium heidelbergense TaxID=53376 RepID=A0A1X0DMS7_MYCHE|nr:NAD(P)/FAD-dependent oxidoreductase [Mycobacterium heidelbergense]MCV7049259.1 NAD(P)/FAD-dependent oxidoreductase [Mycobacterium heidelbergense]ORA73688.1 FAD-dependent oxidoreductase [Mycobacterium heidelbergense]BBZ49762.1 NADH dehydrogenase NdhA [Mycobacterium heidelbergense]